MAAPISIAWRDVVMRRSRAVPFDADSSGRGGQHITERPRPARGAGRCATAVEQVIFKALAKEPTDRYPTAEAMIAALARAIGAPRTRGTPISDGSIGEEARSSLIRNPIDRARL
jgi:hypothetical protein